MLQGEIKLHDEPKPVVNYTTTSYSPYDMLSTENRKDFVRRMESALQDAMLVLNIGDTVTLVSNKSMRMEVIDWVRNPSDVIYYQGDMCVVWMRNINNKDPNNKGIRYSLKELDLSTLSAKECPSC